MVDILTETQKYQLNYTLLCLSDVSMIAKHFRFLDYNSVRFFLAKSKVEITWINKIN